MADDDITQSDSTTSSSDDDNNDLLLDEERNTGVDNNDLVDVEKATIHDEKVDEPTGVGTLGADIGIVDEANLDAALWQKGAGADIDEEEEEDIGDLNMMHVEEFATDTGEEDLEDLEDFNTIRDDGTPR